MSRTADGGHTTNYRNAFIVVAPDSRAAEPAEPPARADPSVAERTFRMIADAPYTYTSDDVIFTVFADRAGVPESERPAARDAYYSVGRACLRSSPLGKTYGWGVHADDESRVALYGIGTPEYERLASGRALDSDDPVAIIEAMRSSRR